MPSPSPRKLLVAGLVLGAAAAFQVGGCQTPTSMTIVVSTDVDCSKIAEEREAYLVAGKPDEVRGSLEPNSTKVCGASESIGDVVLLPRSAEDAAVGVKVILGVDRPTSACGVEGATEEAKWKGCIVARRRLGFVEGEALSVDVPLRAECIGVPCDEAAFTTCVAGGRCVPSDVDPLDCLDGCDEGDLPPTTSSATSSTTSSGEGGAAPGTSVSSTGQGGSGGATSVTGTGGGGGGEPGCVDPTQDCPAPGECATAVCKDGRCDVLPSNPGAPCSSGLCDDAGQCVACLVDAHCPVQACNVESCDAGVCVYQPQSGLACDGGFCDAGVCVLLEHCLNGNLDGGIESDVDCGLECPRCDDGRDCTGPDDCLSGLCTNGTCAACSGDAACPVAQHCDGGRCVDDAGDGGPCDADADCTSGECAAPGFCCGTPCDGACVECSTGTCTPLSIGEQPGCLDDACANGCLANGTCDFEPESEVCAESCVGSTSTTSYCDGAGSCPGRTESESCGFYACVANSATCPTSCDGNADCVAGTSCSSGACVAPGCSNPAECPQPSGPCQVATCNQGECGFADALNDTPCGGGCSPTGDSVIVGACVAGVCQQTTTGCCPYACKAGACLTSCSGDDDCSAGVTCDVGSNACGSGLPGAANCQGI